MSKREEEFYLRDTRSDVGTSCTFWAIDGRGYTSNLDRAETFGFDKAQEYASRKYHFIPLSKARVDAVSVRKVDVQYLKLNTDFSQGIVLQRYLGSYDGNDIYFYNGSDRPTTNYGDALVMFLDDMPHGVGFGAIHSKKFLDTICRRTLATWDVNKRRMMTSAGIMYRTPRPSQSTGRYRGNCPVCGRITWGYCSQDNEFCHDHDQYDLDKKNRRW